MRRVLDHGVKLATHPVGKLRTRRDEDGGSHRVMFGLTHEIGGDEPGIGRLIGKNGDLGGASLRIDAHDSPYVTLGGNNVDVPRSGHHVDVAAQSGNTVGEHGDGLGAPHGVDLIDPEQTTQGEDVRVRQTVELGLRRGGDGDRLDTGHLGGHDVHDDAGGQWCQPTGHVEPHPLHRDDALAYVGTGSELHLVRARLQFDGLAHATAATNGFLEGSSQLWVQIGQGVVKLVGGNTKMWGNHMVESLTELSQGLLTPVPNRIADFHDVMQRRLDVERGTGNDGAVVLEVLPADVDCSHHDASVRGRGRGAGSASRGGMRDIPITALLPAPLVAPVPMALLNLM